MPFYRFLQDDQGATAIEYGMIAAFISLMVVLGASPIGDYVEETFGEIAEGLL